MKKILAILFVILVMQSMSLGLLAVEKGMPDGYKREQMREGTEKSGNLWEKQLKFTAEQNATIQKIKLNYQKEMIPFEAKIKELKIEMREIYLSKDIDDKKLLDITDQVGKQELMMTQKKTNEKLEIYKVLTEEQHQKIRDSKMFLGFWGDGFHPGR